MGTTKSRGNKHKLDKFYTNSKTAAYCLSLLNLDDFDCVIEPSAGNGSFSKLLNEGTYDLYAFDILPEHTDIIAADWFHVDKAQFDKYEKILVVGNPPFGISGSLAREFMVESMRFADTVAFILPRSFKKDSLKSMLPLNFEIQYEVDIRPQSFTLNAETYSVPCVFQIWRKTLHHRVKTVYPMSTRLFTFTDKENADFRVQRVGGNAGVASLNLNVSAASNYFLINTSEYSVDELISVINRVRFPSIDHTVGPKSLPKGELIKHVEEEIAKL